MPLERQIAELAIGQHGVVTLGDLRRCGLSASAVRSRVAAGRLHRVHAGVFAVGHAPLTRNGHFIAAVLACGARSALSHREGAAHRSLRASNRSRVDVTSPDRGGRTRAGIDAHSGASLLPCDVEVVDGIRCTTVARTLLDLTEVVDRRAVERACEQAIVLRVFDLASLEDVLARANGRRGAGVLRSILAEDLLRGRSTFTRSELEERFLALCRDASLPMPAVNAWVALNPTGIEADFLWRPQRLVVDLDGRRFHDTSRAFERDRHRDQRLLLAGWRVVRFTWQQVAEDAAAVARIMRALLGNGGGALG